MSLLLKIADVSFCDDFSIFGESHVTRTIYDDQRSLIRSALPSSSQSNMNLNDHLEEAHQAQANLRRSSRIANRNAFDPIRRRIPQIVSVCAVSRSSVLFFPKTQLISHQNPCTPARSPSVSILNLNEGSTSSVALSFPSNPLCSNVSFFSLAIPLPMYPPPHREFQLLIENL